MQQTPQQQQPVAPKPTLPGAYHSRGVPGEEADVRSRMRVLKVGDRNQRIIKSQPIKGSAGAGKSAAAELELGLRDARLASAASPDAVQPEPGTNGTAVFVLAKRQSEFLNTAVFPAGDSGEEEAVALFTARQQAQGYLDRAGWNETDEVGQLTPDELLHWLREAKQEGIAYVAVNPDRERHLQGEPQPILFLDALDVESTESLAKKLADIARS